jgi:hypothetical protein
VFREGERYMGKVIIGFVAILFIAVVVSVFVYEAEVDRYTKEEAQAQLELRQAKTPQQVADKTVAFTAASINKKNALRLRASAYGQLIAFIIMGFVIGMIEAKRLSKKLFRIGF